VVEDKNASKGAIVLAIGSMLCCKLRSSRRSSMVYARTPGQQDEYIRILDDKNIHVCSAQAQCFRMTSTTKSSSTSTRLQAHLPRRLGECHGTSGCCGREAGLLMLS
jgi:hypothetical protein